MRTPALSAALVPVLEYANAPVPPQIASVGRALTGDSPNTARRDAGELVFDRAYVRSPSTGTSERAASWLTAPIGVKVPASVVDCTALGTTRMTRSGRLPFMKTMSSR